MRGLCRLCAKEKPIRQLLHSIEDEKLNIGQKLNDCCRWSSIVLYEYDKLPKKVCGACYKQLESSWLFAESVAQAQKHLLTLIEDTKPELASIEFISTDAIIDEPSESIEAFEPSDEDEIFDSNEPIEPIEPIEPVKIDPDNPFEQDDSNDTFEEFKVLLKPQKIQSRSENTAPLLEGEYEILESEASKQNEVKEQPKPRKKRYDARKIDFDEIRRKRLQKLPGSLSRLCDTCGRECASTTALRKHILVHLGQTPEARPHVCSTCGKRFRTLYNLKTHANIHTGAKPFKCKHCDYQSACGQNLGKHLREKHQIVRTKPKSSKIKT